MKFPEIKLIDRLTSRAFLLAYRSRANDVIYAQLLTCELRRLLLGLESAEPELPDALAWRRHCVLHSRSLVCLERSCCYFAVHVTCVWQANLHHLCALANTNNIVVERLYTEVLKIWFCDVDDGGES